MEEKEKRNKRLGILISIGAHALLLILFMFILAWREPDPPLPEYGIEINFGLEDQGSGDVQQEVPVTEEAVEEEALPEEPSVEETESQEESESQEEAADPATEQPVENTQESPEVIEEKQEKPVAEKKPEETRQSPPVEKKVDEQQAGAREQGTEETPSQKSEGDDKDVEGDKGEPEGELNPDAVYKGKPGGGNNGPALNIIGWIWDEVPDKKDTSNENGTITFEFTIDEDGYVIGIRTLQRSVSPSVAKFYEKQLQNTTFSRTGSGAVRPGNTKGTVTFNIVSR